MLKIEKLSKRFDQKVVLDEVSLYTSKGENLVIFGRSGTGKSVLLKCIVRLLEPDSGKIFIEDKDILSLKIKELNQIRKQIGFLFQSAALYDSMSVRHNLEFPLIRNFDFTPEQREEKIISVLEKVSLLDAIDKMPSELSGGMRKRVGLARAIITEPKLMLYDEPTTGLDPITSKEISKLILELQKSLKMTSVIVTHDLLCAEIIADRAIMLNEGKIIFEGSLEEMTSSKDPFLVNFFKHEFKSEISNA
ncbi:MAG: ATP-binding cassette domain-containing protein [Ignavibacterium sp.]|nr:ATP-binding cassette domain-containing protein [Ignavibacterium sp.]MCX7612034.1 ATP-binding cassette domain-containing protein [Ignavibacterium sp.]MDW8374819.1 ATP-binding cassette domain-containing protein [Ignavibacteriales bacterium]